MATLKELMGDKTKGDGKKFKLNEMNEDEFFEPIFLSITKWKDEIERDWHGLNHLGQHDAYDDIAYKDWQEWTPPKQTNKVKLYRPIRFKHAQYEISEEWSSCKNKFPENSVATFNNNILGTLYFGKIVGWQEMEVEVDE